MVQARGGYGLTPWPYPRKAFVDGLSPYDRRMLDKAQAYESRMSSLKVKVDARRLFPSEIKGFPAATQRMMQRFIRIAPGSTFQSKRSSGLSSSYLKSQTIKPPIAAETR